MSIHVGQTVTLECGQTTQVGYVYENDSTWCEKCKKYEKVQSVTRFSSRDVTKDRVTLTFNADDFSTTWLSVGNSGAIALFKSPNGNEYAICMNEDGIPYTLQRVRGGDYVEVPSRES